MQFPKKTIPDRRKRRVFSDLASKSKSLAVSSLVTLKLMQHNVMKAIRKNENFELN